MSKAGYGYTSKKVQDNALKYKEQFLKAREEEKKYVMDSRKIFLGYYGAAYDDLGNHEYHSYSFDREAGINLARLYLLSQGYSYEDVFLDQTADSGSTPEEIQHNNEIIKAKRESGQNLLEFMDTNKDDKKMVADFVSKMMVDALPKLLDRMGELAENKYTKPGTVRTKEQLLAGRMAGFIFDMFQETTRGELKKDALFHQFDVYNQKHPEGPKMDYDWYQSISASITSDCFHYKYFSDINRYLSGKAKSGIFTSIVLDALGNKYTDFLRQENMSSGLAMHAAYNKDDERKGLDAKTVMTTYYATELDAKLKEAYTSTELEEALLSGRLVDSMEIDVDEKGIVRSFSVLGVKYDAIKDVVSEPNYNMSKMEVRNEMFLESLGAMKDAQIYNPSTDDNFLTLTGFTKEEFFKDTEDFGYRLGRQTAQSMMITNLLAKGMTLEEALDPALKVEEKHQEALLFQEMIKKPVPEKGTPEYEARYQKIMEYAVDGYWGAKDILEREIKTANSNLASVSSPKAVLMTSQGRSAYAAALIVSDLAQEIAKGKTGELLNKKSEGEPTAAQQLTNLSTASNFVSDAAEMVKDTNQVLAEKDFSTGELLRRAILVAAERSYLESKLKDLQQQNKQTGEKKEPDYFQFITQQDLRINNDLNSSSEQMKKALIEEVTKRFSREEIAKKAISGELVKSVKIDRTKYGIMSISMMGIKAEAVGSQINCVLANGRELPNIMSKETQQAYKQEIEKLIKAANDTNELLVFGNTQNYKDFIAGMKDMRELLSDDDLTFKKVKDALGPVNRSIEKYRRDHANPEKLDSFQKRRLQVMEKITEFSKQVNKYEKNIDSYEHTSLALSNLRKDRYSLEGVQLLGTYPPEDGRMILNNKALAATEHIYQLLAKGTTITEEMKAGVIRDLKTIALSKTIEAESKMQLELQGGALLSTIKKHPSHIDDLIENADIGRLSKMEVFQNPTLEAIEKLMKEDAITKETNAVIKDVYQKAKDARMKAEKAAQAEAERNALAAEKAAEDAKLAKALNITQEEIDALGNFNIDEFSAQEDAKEKAAEQEKNKGKSKTQIEREEREKQQEILREKSKSNLSFSKRADMAARSEDVRIRKRMRASGFTFKVRQELRKGELSDEKLLEKMEKERGRFELDGELEKVSTKEFIEYAKVLNDVEVRRSKSNATMKAFRVEQKKYHTLTQEEFHTIDKNHQQLFLKQKDGRYIDRPYFEKNTKNKDLILVKCSQEQKDDVRDILKRIEDTRSENITAITDAITKSLLKTQDGLKEEEVFKAVREGQILKKMIDTPEKIAELAKVAEGDPSKLGKLYVGKLIEMDQNMLKKEATPNVEVQKSKEIQMFLK